MCGVCAACKRRGSPSSAAACTTWMAQPGMADYMAVRFNSLNRYEGLDHVSACLTEPLAVSLTSVLNAQNSPRRKRGCAGPRAAGAHVGPSGQALRGGLRGHYGASGQNGPARKPRLELAPKMGCDDVIEIGLQDVETEIKKKFPDGVDRVIVSSPPQSLYDALKIIKYGGIITFYGLHFGRAEQDRDRRERTWCSTRSHSFPPLPNRPINFPPSPTALLRDGLVDASALVTHTFCVR